MGRLPDLLYEPRTAEAFYQSDMSYQLNNMARRLTVETSEMQVSVVSRTYHTGQAFYVVSPFKADPETEMGATYIGFCKLLRTVAFHVLGGIYTTERGFHEPQSLVICLLTTPLLLQVC